MYNIDGSFSFIQSARAFLLEYFLKCVQSDGQTILKQEADVLYLPLFSPSDIGLTDLLARLCAETRC